MKERPILFSDAMVRALLAGTKTQTRRIVKRLAPEDAADIGCILPLDAARGTWRAIARDDETLCSFFRGKNGTKTDTTCPYGVPGDRLWARECWAPCTTEGPVDDVESADAAMYRADGSALLYTGTEDARPWHRRLDAYMWKPTQWRPSIFMPRWASRLTFEITSVRCESLQLVTEGDARAEGVTPVGWGVAAHDGSAHREAYARLWDDINGEGSWAANPWVWALTFKRIEAPR